jgi:hypothetical protein
MQFHSCPEFSMVAEKWGEKISPFFMGYPSDADLVYVIPSWL